MITFHLFAKLSNIIKCLHKPLVQLLAADFL